MSHREVWDVDLAGSRSVSRHDRQGRAGQRVTPRSAAQRTGHRLTNRGAFLLIAASFVFMAVCFVYGLNR